MKRFLLPLLFLSFYSSGCGSHGSKNSASSDAVSADSSNASLPAETAAIDMLMAQHEADMDRSNKGHQAFKRVLQSLKDGTMDINDAFIRSGADGGTKCNKQYKWEPYNMGSKPAEWQTFLIHIVEYGCTPGDCIPYLEYAKAQGADFKVWDMYGRSLLHLLVNFPNRGVEAVLAWLLDNTDAKDLINESRRKEGDPEQSVPGTAPYSDDPALQAILKHHGSTRQ
jgi:hypothetical protein